MGINGLLQLLKDCCKQRKLHQYKGQRTAIDTYAWLHKIIKGPSGLALIKGGKDKFKFVRDILKRIDKLRSNGVEPVLVFDGGPLPRKRQEEQARKKRREESYLKAKELLDAGDEEGYKKMAESIDISPDMAYHLIVELKKHKIEFIVAPYQADAQLAYLCRTGYVDFILTEDSDLLAFGAPKVLYKFDFINFTGQQICLDNIKRNPKVSFNWFTHGMFLTTCILSGCDYLGQLPGIGIKRAQKVISRVTTFRRFIEEHSSETIPNDYEENFIKAFLTFRYQRVYCPKRKMCVSVNEMDFNVDVEQLKQIDQSNTQWSQQVLNYEVLEYVKNHLNEMDFDFLGPLLTDEIAKKIAEGTISPITFEEYKLDDLDSLKYNGPGILVDNLNIPKPISTKLKDKALFREESIQMANFLNSKPEKRNLLAKPNYRPLKIAQQEEFECFSIDSQSDCQQRQMVMLKNIPSKDNKQEGKDSKDRKLKFKNQSDESEEQEKSGDQISSSSSNKPDKEKDFGLSLDSFIFEKQVQKKSIIEISDKDIQFNFTKQNKTFQQKPIEYKPQVNGIQESYEIQEVSHFQGFDLNQFEYKQTQKMSSIESNDSQQQLKDIKQPVEMIHEPSQCSDMNSEDIIRIDKEIEGDSNQLKHITGSASVEMYEKGERSQQTDDTEEKNPFFALAKSIKPMFEQDFFRNPFKAFTQ